MGEDQQNNQNIHVQRIMNESEEREICYLKCVIKSGRLEFEWSIITPSTWDWIGLYENNSKENTNWLNGHWFYIANHSRRETLTDGRYSFTGSHWIGTVSGQNQIKLNTYESRNVYRTYAHANVLNPDFAHFDKSRIHYVEKGLQLLFNRHKTDWGFDQDDNWNNQNRAYLVVDHTTHQCLIIYRGGEKDYFLWSGWVLDDDQYKYVTTPPYRLKATILLMYEDILEQIANSEGVREDLLQEYFKIHRKDRNTYGEKIYFKIAEFFGLAESYIPFSFEGRDEITPEDDYELDFEKVREKARTIIGELEKITF
ncbi:13773_t:CDS:2 [Funneliformis mosseae]|uniref:13773_t:CDS:1 n=1 Tax=Funneliformis mosseae TaxID=27381 RepID=A0A9N8UYG4_FUNMO|nr:13773_t:CDS:2 [Funneliformis mosseae]